MQLKIKIFITKYFKFFVLGLLLYVPIFGFLDNLPIRIWDEARIAVNAIEMYLDGDYIVTHWLGKPEMWNTKPPLLIWCQVILFKIIGVNEIAIRLPSSVAVLFTCLSLLFFLNQYLKNIWVGIIAVLILITSQGYICNHVARTGDYDAMLILFTTSSCLFFYTFCETKNNRFLYYFFICLTLGVLTKGVASMLFTPALFIYVLIQKYLSHFIRNRHFYYGLLLFVIISLGYYFIRENQNQGYISTVQQNELGGRFLQSQGNLPFDFWYYYDFFKIQIGDRYLLIPCGFAIGLLSKDARVKRLSIFLLIISVFFFLVISISRTKCNWYSAPLFPWFAIIISLFVSLLFDNLKKNEFIQQSLKKNVVPYIFLFLIFFPSYKIIWNNTYNPSEDYWDRGLYEMGYYLKNEINRGGKNLENSSLVYGGYSAHNIFYILKLKSMGIKTDMKDYAKIKVGDLILACQDDIKGYINQNFLYKEIERKQNVIKIQITGNLTKKGIN